MKNEYDFLNEIEVTEKELQEIEEMEVNELEVKSLKKKLKAELGRKKSIWKKKGVIAAGICCGLIAGTVTLGITNPTLAANIPVVGDIFRFLDGGRTGTYDLYQQNAAGIHTTQEDNGISITIEDAVFDGRSVYYTYIIDSEQNLGKGGPLIEGEFNIKNYFGGMGGSSQIEQAGKNRYVGQDEYTIDEQRDSVEVELHFKTIEYFIGDEQKEIKGNWKFAFQLDAIPQKQQKVNRTVEKEAISITVDNITKTPMSLILNFQYQIPSEQYNSISIDMKIKDENGTEYLSNGSTVHGEVNTGIYYGVFTFGKIEESAKKIIITPSIMIPSGGGGVSIDENGKETHFETVIPEDIKALDGLEFDPIEIELQN